MELTPARRTKRWYFKIKIGFIRRPTDLLLLLVVLLAVIHKSYSTIDLKTDRIPSSQEKPHYLYYK